jgi:hypothetical protein
MRYLVKVEHMESFGPLVKLAASNEPSIGRAALLAATDLNLADPRLDALLSKLTQTTSSDALDAVVEIVKQPSRVRVGGRYTGLVPAEQIRALRNRRKTLLRFLFDAGVTLQLIRTPYQTSGTGPMAGFEIQYGIPLINDQGRRSDSDVVFSKQGVLASAEVFVDGATESVGDAYWELLGDCARSGSLKDLARFSLRGTEVTTYAMTAASPSAVVRIKRGDGTEFTRPYPPDADEMGTQPRVLVVSEDWYRAAPSTLRVMWPCAEGAGAKQCLGEAVQVKGDFYFELAPSDLTVAAMKRSRALTRPAAGTVAPQGTAP